MCSCDRGFCGRLQVLARGARQGSPSEAHTLKHFEDGACRPAAYRWRWPSSGHSRWGRGGARPVEGVNGRQRYASSGTSGLLAGQGMGCCARRRADLRSAQLPHSGCCGACPATRCGWRAPEWGGSCLRSLVLDGKGQLEGQDWALLRQFTVGIGVAVLQ